jgi:chromosome partitioning protein
VIPVDTQFREASRAGVPLNVYNPQARGAQAYDSLLRWLLAPAEAVEAPAAQALAP